MIRRTKLRLEFDFLALLMGSQHWPYLCMERCPCIPGCIAARQPVLSETAPGIWQCPSATQLPPCSGPMGTKRQGIKPVLFGAVSSAIRASSAPGNGIHPPACARREGRARTLFPSLPGTEPGSDTVQSAKDFLPPPQTLLLLTSTLLLCQEEKKPAGFTSTAPSFP